MQEGLELAEKDLLHSPGLQKGRQRVGEIQANPCPRPVQEPRRFDPAPGGAGAAGKPPGGTQVGPGSPGLGDHLLAHQKAQLDSNPGEADGPPPSLVGCRQVVVPGKGLPAHPLSVVEHSEGSGHRIRPRLDLAGSGIQGVRYDLS